jgi:hypothetical protein
LDGFSTPALDGLRRFLADVKGPVEVLDFTTRKSVNVEWEPVGVARGVLPPEPDQPKDVEFHFYADYGELRCYVGGRNAFKTHDAIATVRCQSGVLSVTSAETGETKSFTSHRSHQ